jgi:ribosomal protein S27AE
MKNDWGLTYNMDWPSNSKYNNSVHERQTFNVKLCPKCNFAYETTFNQYKKQLNTHYYDDFPRLRLKKQTCERCE